MRRPRQSERWRVAVFIAVLGLHFAVGLLLFSGRTIRIVRPNVDTPVSLLTLPRESPAQTPAVSSASVKNLKRRQISKDFDQSAKKPAAEPNNAITMSFDLKSDADAAARRQADQQQNERRWRNLAGPSESQLEWWKNNAPLTRDHHLPGDSEHAEGGELITWVDDKCFYTTHSITTFGMPGTSKVCKDPPKAETDLFKDMRKKLDEGAKGRAP